GQPLRRSAGRRRQAGSRARARPDRRTRPAVRQDRDAVRRRRPGAPGRTGRDPQPRPGRPVRRHHEGNLRMNIPVDAIDIEVARPVPRTPSHPTHKLKMLLKREFWEHKGGFLWAPFWACVGSLLVTFMALVVGEVAARRAIGAGKLDGGNLTADGV